MAKDISNLVDLQKAVSEAASKDTDNYAGWRLLQGAGPMLAVANVPLAIILTLIGAIGESVSQNKNLSEARMPDSWLLDVSNSNSISSAGLAFLAKKCDAKGFISVKDAVKWVGIEDQEAKNSTAKARIAAEKSTPGAQALLARAALDRGGDFVDQIVSGAAKSIQPIQASFSAVASKLAEGVLRKKSTPAGDQSSES